MSSLVSHEDDGDVSLFFVIPANKEETECTDAMKEAFKMSDENEFVPTWKTEESCLSLSPSKTSVFVFEKFDGPAFHHLQTFKCVIIGPRCLLSCLIGNEQVPIVSYPTYTAAMRELTITCSGGGPEVKKKIKELVELMAGTYLKSFTAKITHVVVSSVMSSKYEKALEMGIPVMTHDWVHAVWKASIQDNVLATDRRFDRYKCPPFFDLRVCATGLNAREIDHVKCLVERYGGTYDPSLTQAVHILIVKKSKGNKFKFAKSWSIPCVELRWIDDSVQNGHALPTKSYEVTGSWATSSPTSEQDPVNIFSASDVSTIQFEHRSHVDETLLDSTTLSVASYCPQPLKANREMPPPTTPVKRDRTTMKRGERTPVKKDTAACPTPGELKYRLNDLDLSQAKRAGTFLDGCGVFLSGWNADEEEKLKRILKCSGAARFTDLCDNVTHILVGNLEKAFVRTLKNLPYKLHVVNIQWLIESVSEKRPAAEEEFSCFPSDNSNPSEAPSPLSKKGMALLQRENFSPRKAPGFQAKPTKETESSPNKGHQLLAQYMSSEMPKNVLDSSADAMPPPPSVSGKPELVQQLSLSTRANDSDLISSQGLVFSGLTFVVVGVGEEASDYVENELIKRHGGEVVPKSYKGVSDYAVVPLYGASLKQTATDIVTALWLEDCVESRTLVPVSYYHEPVALDVTKKPLEGCVLGLSGYSGQERKFILELAKALGGHAQEVFAKKSKPDVKASTHLVCRSSESSQKYNAAIKWGRPVVSHKWLLSCASSGMKVPEKSYFLDPNQVIKPCDSLNSSTVSISSVAMANSRFETPPHIAALKRLPCFKTPEPTPVLHDKAEVERILNYKPSPNVYEVPTPPVPLGLSDNPSPGESKRIQRWLDRLPGKLPPSPPRRDSTPLHVLRKRILEKNTVTTPEILGEVPSKDQREAVSDMPESAVALSKAGNKGEDHLDFDSEISIPKPRKLFENNEDSALPIDGQLDKLKKLMETPDAVDEKLPSSSKATSVKSDVSDAPETQLISDSIKELKDGSQPYAIKWEDPVNVNRVNKDGYSSPLKQSNRNVGEEVVTSAKRKSSENAECEPEGKKIHTDVVQPVSSNTNATKKYAISLSSVGNKEPHISMIKKLGGILLDCPGYDPSATHLLLEKAPARSEKLLAFIASGKWVLHISYLTESSKQGKFLKEEDFEWGNPRNVRLLKPLKSGSVEEALAKAAHRWRITLTGSKRKGAFDEFRCKIFASDDKTLAFKRLVSAGGGTVLPENSKEIPSFCLVNVSSGKVDIADCAKQGIPCVPVTFLYDHLVEHPAPSVESKTVPEYKKRRAQYEAQN